MNIQEVAKQAVDIVMRYYNNDIQPFLDACDEDVLWIGPAENQIIRTREALVAAFAAEKNDLRFVVHDLKVIPIPTTNSHVCEIILVFTVDTIWPDGSVNRVRQRIQLTVTERRGTIRLRVCHISNAIVYDERDTIYPIHYESNYKKFMLAGEQRSERVQIKSISKALLFLNSSQILYVETARSHTVIHTVEEDYESVESLQTLTNRYPDLFVRCHASYLVNPQYVSEIRRFRIRLQNGIELPVPEKKYMAVKTELQKRCSEEKTENVSLFAREGENLEE